MPRALTTALAISGLVVATFGAAAPAGADDGAPPQSLTEATSGSAAPQGLSADREARRAEANRLDWRHENGESHASGNHPQSSPGPHKNKIAESAVNTVRIGLRYSYTPSGARSEFYSFDHPAVEITGADSEFLVTDQATGTTLFTGQPGEVVTVAADGTGYLVTTRDGDAQAVDGPVRFTSDGPLAVPSIERLNIVTWADYLVPEYHGDLEVTRGDATPEGRVNLVNEVELETYVRGVVINESPAFFHTEALKAQVTAARGYAVGNIGRFIAAGQPFDLDDSPMSQVYRGATAEHEKGNAAAEATTGLVATYDGDIISAYYSSSMAGHPDDVQWSFDGTGDAAEAVPYLVGRYDGPAGTEPDLSTEEGLRKFWAQDQPQVYDSTASAGNPRNRWTFELTKEQAEANIAARRGSANVISGSSETIGELEGCEGTLRSPTGRMVVVECTGSEAVWRWIDWDEVRRLFPSPSLGVLNNPAFLDHDYDEDGILESITVIGGGWGHNVGLSQYGANGRGQAGQDFLEILTFYYKDTTIGSFPVAVSAAPGTSRIEQEFTTPDGTGTLEVRSDGVLGAMTVTVNGSRLFLNRRDLRDPVAEFDISEHLRPGDNVIRYAPIGDEGSASALVAVTGQITGWTQSSLQRFSR